jgi:4-hydroxybenzoate polyprenyltransferase
MRSRINVTGADVKSKLPYLTLLRAHHWAKNLLVFVPLVLAQKYESSAIASAVVAFVAFSLVASAAYIINDVIDRGADRLHPQKQHRPVAAGSIAPSAALAVVPVLLIAAGLASYKLGLNFSMTLAFYFALTCAYSLRLRMTLFLDIIALGCLYAIRMVAGGYAAGVEISEWLTAFAVFFFISLALMKRYAELVRLSDAGEEKPERRAYQVSDAPLLIGLAAASAFASFTVFSQYISSIEVHRIYEHPARLWIVGLILMYWLTRMLFLVHRKKIDDDPIVFAISDSRSLGCGLLVFLALFLLG